VKTAFKALYFLGLLAEIAIRVPHEWRRRATRMEGDRADSLERSLIGLLSVGMLLVPGIYVTIPWLDRSDYRLPPQVERRVGRIGTAFLASALILFWRSHADLGRNWSPSLQLLKDHRLVTGGVYRHVRHPMYASSGCGASPRSCSFRIGSRVGPALLYSCPCTLFGRRARSG
jgi:protein-S-isoprenylcysteine O-methyltransferase Ste14